MPQMNPMNWTILFIVFNAIFFSLNIKTNFLFKAFPTTEYNFNSSVSKFFKLKI